MSSHDETTEYAFLVVRMFGIAATPELHLGYLIAHRDIREAQKVASQLNVLRTDRTYSYDIARIEVRGETG